jgi:phenylalanyl-tRNA synthetase alpha subunit
LSATKLSKFLEGWDSIHLNPGKLMMITTCLPLLNFPEGHPARDDYDTFTTEEGLIAPAHTSTMQNRVLKEVQK